MRDYVRVCPVLLAKAAGDNPELRESEALVKRQRRDIVSHDSVELKHPEAKLLTSVEAVGNKLAPDMLSAHIRAHRIACVGDMSAPADVVRVEDVQPHYLAVILGCGGEALRREKLLCGLLRE